MRKVLNVTSGHYTIKSLPFKLIIVPLFDQLSPFSVQIIVMNVTW